MLNKLKTAVQFSLAVVLTFAVIEIFLTYSGVSSASKYEFGDKKLFQRLKPGHFIISQNEGFFMGTTNDYGYLGPSYKPIKANNVFRIALLGDSYVEGFQLFEAYHFRSILESGLRKVSGKKIEVLNFGRSGFDFHQMYSYYELFVKDFHPDLTLLITADHDFNPVNTFNYIKVISDSGGVSLEKNFPDYDGDPKWKIKKYLDHSSLITLFRGAVEIASTDQAPKILFGKLYSIAKSGSQLKDVMPGESRKPLNKTSVNILKALSKEMGADKKFAVVFRTEASPEYAGLVDSLQIPYIDLTPAIRGLKEKGIDPNYWPVTRSRGHWNHYAHKVVGETLTKEILRMYGGKLYAPPEFKFTASAEKK